MTSAALRRPLPAGRVEGPLVAALLLVAGVAWVLTAARMEGMDAGPGTELGGLGWFVVAWLTMMAAMMLPSMAPAALAHARLHEGHRALPAGILGATTGLFVAGYLASWGAAGIAGYALVEGVRALDPGFLAWDEAGRFVAAGAIAGAALYQLTPLKDRCLRHCRSPLGFMEAHWRPGPLGAVRMGMEHGGLCLGCCWTLMATLFAVGVMSLGMMAFVAALIAAEKLLPRRAAVSRGVAVLLAVLSLAVAVAPEDVPWLTIPGSHETMEEMS
jgi:predicted metal-binding membrane protein